MWIYLSGINITASEINQTTHNIDSKVTTLQNGYIVTVNDVDKVILTEDYKVTLTIQNSDGSFVNATTTPKITLTNPLGSIRVENWTMSYVRTGVYEYSYTTTSSDVEGIWKSEINLTVNGEDATVVKYWRVEGSAAQVRILEMTDTSIPTISARVNITNEGSVGYEYTYEYCVVENQNDQCGDGTELSYVSGAKYINAGESWTPTLELDGITTSGKKWFKIKVHYGGKVSGASTDFISHGGSGIPSFSVTGKYIEKNGMIYVGGLSIIAILLIVLLIYKKRKKKSVKSAENLSELDKI